MRSRSWILLGLLVVGSGCTDTKLQIYGKQAPEKYLNVVVLSPSAAEVCAGTFARLVAGRAPDCNSPGTVRHAPVVADGTSIDYAKLAKIHCDAVVYDASEVPAPDRAKLDALHIPVFAIEGDTLQAYTESLFEFGRRSGSEELGSKYVDRIEAELSVARADRPNPPVRTCVIRVDNFRGLQVACSDGFLGDVMRQTGGEPVGPPGKGWVDLDGKWLAAQDPEMLVIAGEDAPVVGDPRVKDLKAVKTGHAFGVFADTLTRRGERVDYLVKSFASLIKSVRTGKTN